jgi:hypothetical protein
MKQANAKSAAAAKLLGEIGTIVEVVKDSGPTTFTVTTSKPWALGHGAWVVGLEGISGGYDCARVTPIANDPTFWTKIEFEDRGQDLVGVYIGIGIVQWTDIASLGGVFGGAEVLNDALKIGGKLKIKTRHGSDEIRYPITSISSVLKRDVVRAALEPRGKAVLA